MSKTTITELRRTGSGFYEATPVRFEWDSATHTGIQGDVNFELAVKTARFEIGEDVVEHVMAATWQPFEIGGRWKDCFAGRGFAERTMTQFAQLVGRTPLVRLQLDRLSWTGLLTNARFTYITVDNIGWSATLSPHTNETVGRFQPTKPISPIVKPLQQHHEAIADSVTAIETVNTSIASYPAGTEDVVDVAPVIAGLTDANARIADVIAGATGDAQRALLTAATTLRRARNAALELLGSMRSKRAGTISALDGVIDVLRFDGWVRSIREEATRAAGLALIAEQDMRRRAERKPRALHVARSNDTLERLALRYYGTPDAWKTIFDANHLDALVFEGGEELIIPERAA